MSALLPSPQSQDCLFVDQSFPLLRMSFFMSNNFTPTHRLQDQSSPSFLVRAWNYRPTAPIPLWVARNFHDYGDGRKTHRSGYVVSEDDWIIDMGGAATVLSDLEFQKLFVAL